MPTSRRLRDAPSSLLPGKAMWPTLLVLILIVLVFAGIRIAVDWPNVANGIVPDGTYERRFALHPVLIYAHILPGVVYLVGAPFQLWRRFRERHFSAHRRMGRVVLPAGIITGIFVIQFSFGGVLEGYSNAASASRSGCRSCCMRWWPRYTCRSGQARRAPPRRPSE